MKPNSSSPRVHLGLVIIALLIQLTALSQTNCYFQDIGSAGGTGPTTANGLSLAGAVVVGSTPTPDGVYHAYYWKSNIMTLLPSLGGNSQANAVNRRGNIVAGYSFTTNGCRHAVVWTLGNGAIIDLGTLGGTNSVATALNQKFVVGYSQTTNNTEDAFIVSLDSLGGGNLTDLGSLQPSGGYTIATGINYASPPEVCGQSLWINTDWHGYPGPNYYASYWINDNIGTIGTMSGPNSYAAGINDNGDMCGTSVLDWHIGGGTVGFLRKDGAWTQIGNNSATVVPAAINNSDVIVGQIGNSAIIWENGTLYGLTSLVQGIPTTLTSANAINDYGQMVANGADGHAYLLSPVEQPIIYSQPKSQTAAFGTNATFSVTAVGFPSLTYQWSFNGTNIPGATSSTLTVTNLQIGDAGAYTVAVSDPAGTTSSDPADLTVRPSLDIHLVPALSLVGNIGSSYAIQYVNSVGPANADWTTLEVVQLVSSPQFWSDYSAIGQPQRFYRLLPQ